MQRAKSTASSVLADTQEYVCSIVPSFVRQLIVFDAQLWFAAGDFFYSRFFTKQLVRATRMSSNHDAPHY